MPLTYTIDNEARLLTVVGRGPFVLNDLRELMAKLDVDQAYWETRAVVADLREMDLRLSADELEQSVAAAGARRNIVDWPFAFVVKDDPMTQGLARLLATLATFRGWEAEVFVDADAAHAWVWMEDWPSQSLRKVAPAHAPACGTAPAAGTRVVALHGSVAGPDALAAYGELQQAVNAPGCTRVVVDLSDVTLIDSCGLGSLLQVRVMLVRRGLSMALRGPRGDVKELLDLCQLGQVWEIE